MPILLENDFQSFLKNGRPNFNDSCVIWCDGVFDRDQNLANYYTKQSTQEGSHAEVLLLERLQDMEERYASAFSEVTMYCSFSPCADCVANLVQFAEERPNMMLRIICSSVYYHNVKCHQTGLILLNNTPNIELRVFNREDWNYLNSLRVRGNISNTKWSYLQAWDKVWEEQLGNIMHGALNQMMDLDSMGGWVHQQVYG